MGSRKLCPYEDDGQTILCYRESRGDECIDCNCCEVKMEQDYDKGFQSEQETQYEKTLQKGINLLKNNPNAIIDILKVTTRLSYLRGRLFEQNQKNVQAGVSHSDTLGQSQTASSDEPQDESGVLTSDAKDDTGNSAFPADSTSRAARKILKRLRLRN